jgi:hypothetical protein
MSNKVKFTDESGRTCGDVQNRVPDSGFLMHVRATRWSSWADTISKRRPLPEKDHETPYLIKNNIKLTPGNLVYFMI